MCDLAEGDQLDSGQRAGVDGDGQPVSVHPPLPAACNGRRSADDPRRSHAAGRNQSTVDGRDR